MPRKRNSESLIGTANQQTTEQSDTTPEVPAGFLLGYSGKGQWTPLQKIGTIPGYPGECYTAIGKPQASRANLVRALWMQLAQQFMKQQAQAQAQAHTLPGIASDDDEEIAY